MDYYFTIQDTLVEEIKIEKSIFIAKAIPLHSKDEISEHLDIARVEHYNANHNTYAYRFGPDGLDFRYNDDGEPKGSAGKPILFAIKKYDLYDLLVIVTRYFGGVKLGVGGLVRAYGDAAELVLEKCKKKQVDLTDTVEVFCTYEDVSAIKRLIDEYSVKYKENYADAVFYETKIPLSKVDEFTSKIVSSTSARAGFRVLK